MDQIPLLILSPILMASSSLMMQTDLEVNSTSRLASQNIPRDIKGRWGPGEMLALSAWRGRLMPRCARSKDDVCVAWMVFPSVIPTIVPSFTFTLFLQGVLTQIKFPVVPESATAVVCTFRSNKGA